MASRDDDEIAEAFKRRLTWFENKTSPSTKNTLQRPKKPTIVKITHSEVALKWSAPKHRSKRGLDYIVKYKSTDTHEEKWMDCMAEETDTVVSNLKPNTTYVFGVCSKTDKLVSELSELTEEQKTLPISPPLKIAVKGASKRSITITWRRPKVVAQYLHVGSYNVMCSQSKNNQWITYTTDSDIRSFTLTGLQPSTKHSIKVVAVCQTGETGEPSDQIQCATASDDSSAIRKHTQLFKKGDKVKGKVDIYKLPLKMEHSSEKFSTYQVFPKNKTRFNERGIMVVGASGAGKSTLIDGIVNFIFKVEWGDSYRLKIINEKGENEAGQAHSQTQFICSYTINPTEGYGLDYSLTIIDTPGFGDTRGIGQDRLIEDQVREFFQNTKEHAIDQIHAICFVAQASQARLTPTQRHVFGSILGLFGKDVAKNIMLLITFADGETPPVLDAIEEAKFPFPTDNIFTFNNSALFANNGSAVENELSKMFWNMGEKSMMEFFASLNQLQPQSLSLTQEVLEERKRLDTALEGLHVQIKLACSKMEELKGERAILAEKQAELCDNEHFDYEVDVQQCKTIPVTKGYTTNCKTCHVTCHYPCTLEDNANKMNCVAMTTNLEGEQVCAVCPGRCPWKVHVCSDYRYEFYTEKITRTFDHLKDRYNYASDEKTTLEKIIEKLEENLIAVQMCAFYLITEAQKSLKLLRAIALKPDPLSTVGYIDLLIEAEKNEAKPGWQKRLQALSQVRNEEHILRKLINAKGDASEEFAVLTELNDDDEKRAKLIEKVLNSPSNPLEQYAPKFQRDDQEARTGFFSKIFQRVRSWGIFRSK